MKERFLKYIRENFWWIFAFLMIVISDTLLTMFILHNQLGYEANPFIGDKMFDWTLHWFRIDMVMVIIPFIALMPLSFTFVRNWLLQGVTVGYSWSVINEVSILSFQTDIGIYQFLPGWAYFFGIAFQFAVGFLILWVVRKLL